MDTDLDVPTASDAQRAIGVLDRFIVAVIYHKDHDPKAAQNALVVLRERLQMVDPHSADRGPLHRQTSRA